AVGTGDGKTAGRVREYRDAESEVGSSIPGESWRCDASRRLDARTTQDTRASIEAHLSLSFPEWLCASGLSHDRRRAVLPVGSESEPPDCAQRRFCRLGRAFRSSLRPIATEDHHRWAELRRPNRYSGLISGTSSTLRFY